MTAESRNTYLGSHDTSAIFGLNPFMSAINVFMNKLGMNALRDEDDIPEYMQFGKIMQPVILKEFAKRTGLELSSYAVEEETFIRHPELDWFGGTPDALIVGEKAGVDAKNVRWNRGDWGEEDSGVVPEYVAMQCHHLMTLLDYDRWYVAVLFGGCEFKKYVLHRDPEISEMIIEADKDFWENHILKEIPPDIDDSESWGNYIRRKFPKDNGEIRAATVAEMEILAELQVAKALEENWKKKGDLLKNKLALSIGDAAKLDCDIAKVSYTTAKGRETIDSKKLKAEYPEIAKEYLKIGEAGRTLRITFKGEEGVNRRPERGASIDYDTNGFDVYGNHMRNDYYEFSDVGHYGCD